MAAKTPIKATFSGSDVTGLAEYTSSDFIEVADGGTGVVTLTSGGVLVGAGTGAVTTNKAAPSGDFVGTSDTQTLTNKTLTTPTLTTPLANAGLQLKNGATSAGFIEFFEDSDNGTNKATLIGPASTADVTITLPAATDTLVGKATTDTLTNKTLTSPTITEPEVSTTLDMNAQASTRYYDSDSSNFVAFKAPATVATSFTMSWPDADGASGHVMTTDGAGNLSFAAGGGGGSSSGYNNSTISTIPGKNGNFDLSYNVAQTVQETPFDSGATDPFGVNLGSVFSMMDPVGTIEDNSGDGLDLGAFT
jgi:hypothetical protein